MSATAAEVDARSWRDMKFVFAISYASGDAGATVAPVLAEVM
jgi:hypothetical protein